MPAGGRVPGTDRGPKILWMIDSPPRGDLAVTGTNLSGPGTFSQTFEGAGSYPSVLKVPSPGCWKLDLKIGNTEIGEIALPVVEPSEWKS